MNTCGHDAPRLTDAPRCHQCGAYAHGTTEPYKVMPPKWWLLEWLTRRSVRKEVAPQLEGRVTRD
jgi:hypothetical protein